MSNRVVIDSPRTYSPDRKEKIKRAVLSTLRFLRYRRAYISVYLVTDQEITLLNKRFRGKSGATTVLSFVVSAGFPEPYLTKGERSLGDIYLAPRYITRVGENIERLAVHGTLHLAGYTHASHRDRMKMELLEQRIVLRLRL